MKNGKPITGAAATASISQGLTPLDDPARFRRRLLGWYRRHARDLPWRRSRDPYAVWLSEIMLQQTQVATVHDYFLRFMAALPDIRALAAAPEEQVLRLWEGLGYYRRARQLHRAAQVIVAEHGGEFPRDADAVRRLPGIGRYTAGAILSIAFDQPEPILEANTIRLFSRLLGYRGDPRKADGQRQLWDAAERLVPRRGAGAFNQALMELGSRVCTPRQPQCAVCPVSAQCRAVALGQQEKIPPPQTRPAPEDVREAALLVRRGARVLLVKRDGSGRWAGLWDFPRFALEDAELTDALLDLTGIEARLGQRLTTLKHGVTRFRITLDAYEAKFVRRRRSANTAEVRWVSTEELRPLPLNTTGRKLAALLA